MNSISKRSIPILLIAFIALFSTVSYAKSEISTSFFSSTAVSGYDTVAYFTQNKPVKGTSKFATKYQGATWYFSSQENFELFTKSPEQYAPQYGGYCAWAVANDDVARSDPQAWTIIDDKLYLNYDFDIQEKWLKEPKNLIIKADQNWPSVLN